MEHDESGDVLVFGEVLTNQMGEMPPCELGAQNSVLQLLRKLEPPF